MKRCPRCSETKSFDHFNKNSRKKDGCQSICRLCQNARDLGDYYLLPGRKEAVRARADSMKKEMIKWYRGLKDAPCTDCGVQYPYYVMQWDHLNNKEFSIATAMVKCWGKKHILAEIAKCELVCANCHCTRTHQRRARVLPPPGKG